MSENANEWRILALLSVPGAFVLYTPDGGLIADDPDPRELSRFAFARGAERVRHDYDLTLAERPR